MRTAIILIGVCTVGRADDGRPGADLQTGSGQSGTGGVRRKGPCRTPVPGCRGTPSWCPPTTRPGGGRSADRRDAGARYPPDKLQVLLLLEADDQVTIDAARDFADSGRSSPSSWFRRRNRGPGPKGDATTGCTSPRATSSPSTTPRIHPSRCNCAPRRGSPSAKLPTTSPASGQTRLPQRPTEHADGVVHRELRLWFGYLLPG